MTLPGPSRTIVVEPVEVPEPAEALTRSRRMLGSPKGDEEPGHVASQMR